MSRVMVLILVALAAGAAAGPALHRDERATEEGAAGAPASRGEGQLGNATTPSGPVVCNPATPCGWTVYTPFTKTVEYFMKNDYCNCHEDRSCSYYEDDISIGAFVHRCQLSTTTSTTSTTSTAPTPGGAPS